LIPKMKHRGLVVIGMRDWYGNAYLLHHIEPYPTLGHPDEIDLKEAGEFGREMVERSRRISAGETNLIPPEPVMPPREIPGDMEKSGDIITSFKRLLKYDKAKCRYPKCHLCMDNCPMYGIDLSVDPPVLADPCHPCEFCARICPTGALDMTEWVLNLSKATEKVTEYMILPHLDKAEAEGKFRRLIPKDKLDLKTYGYMLHTKHPQWVIGKGPR
jgi:ferredoxin